MTTKPHTIDKINFGILGIANYKGCILRKEKEGYIILGKVCKDGFEVDEWIRECGRKLKKSLDKGNKILDRTFYNSFIVPPKILGFS